MFNFGPKFKRIVVEYKDCLDQEFNGLFLGKVSSFELEGFQNTPKRSVTALYILDNLKFFVIEGTRRDWGKPYFKYEIVDTAEKLLSLDNYDRDSIKKILKKCGINAVKKAK